MDHLILAIEIISTDSPSRDWRGKYLEYQAANVKEYWVIDPRSQAMECYSLTADQGFAQMKETEGKIHSVVLTGFYLRQAWLWQKPLPPVAIMLCELGVIT